MKPLSAQDVINIANKLGIAGNFLKFVSVRGKRHRLVQFNIPDYGRTKIAIPV